MGVDLAVFAKHQLQLLLDRLAIRIDGIFVPLRHRPLQHLRGMQPFVLAAVEADRVLARHRGRRQLHLAWRRRRRRRIGRRKANRSKAHSGIEAALWEALRMVATLVYVGEWRVHESVARRNNPFGHLPHELVARRLADLLGQSVEFWRHLAAIIAAKEVEVVASLEDELDRLDEGVGRILVHLRERVGARLARGLVIALLLGVQAANAS